MTQVLLQPPPARPAATATWREQALVFDCQGEALVGVLSLPATETDRCLVIVVGGPQYRAGSHRLFVQLARAAAAGGIAALRFDVRGMGDSSGAQRPFEAIGDDIAAALGAAQAAQPALKRFVLWGLCDGASAALLYLDSHRDARIDGLCLVNPWVRSAQSQARTQVKHYYLQRLRQQEFWTKLLSGRVAWKALSGLALSLRAATQTAARTPAAAPTYQDRMARGLERFTGPVLLVLSGEDYTAREFEEYVAAQPHWQLLLARPQLRRHDLQGADHTVSDSNQKGLLLATNLGWLAQLS